MQQLFIISTLQKKGNQLFIPNVPELLAQLRKVLRAKIGDSIFVQSEEGEKIRYEMKIIHRTDKDLEGEIIGTQFSPLLEGGGWKPEGVITLLIAMPNKREKAELIVQKLSEIGINEILFRPAERSVIKQRNEKKAERLRKIAKEAVEQSRGRQLPKIARWNPLNENSLYRSPWQGGGRRMNENEVWERTTEGGLCGRVCPKTFLIFDKTSPQKTSPTSSLDTLGTSSYKGGLCGVIWPEGGLTPNDYKHFPEAKIIGLGATVLRMETAAIIGGWRLINLL